MIFFFKKKPIVLHCVTHRPELTTLAPVQKASKFLPEWWKSLPGQVRMEGMFHDLSTMKHCVGFKDLYRNGVIIPLWSDLALQIGSIGSDFYRYQFGDGCSQIEIHNSIQHNHHFHPTKYQHLKIKSPWAFSCEEDINFSMNEPTWSLIQYPTVRLMPGVVNYKYQMSTNINFFAIRTHEVQEILLPFLDPICHITPFSDRPLKLIVSDDMDLYMQITKKQVKTTFVGKYKANMRAIKFFGGKK